jgi:nucleoside-diphosphate kinase
VQRTLVLIKPDAVQRSLSGKIISRLENKGLKLVGIKLIHVDEILASKHYGEHIGKPFYNSLVEFITSSPVIALAVEGDNSVQVVRNLMGATNPVDSLPGTIRGDYGLTIGMNLIHGSDSEDSANRELAIFFNDSELINYDRQIDDWIKE